MNVTEKNIASIMAVAYVQTYSSFKRLLRQRLLPFFLLTVGVSAVFAGEVGTIIQATGAASIDGQAARVGMVVRQSQRLETGSDGYIYVKTRDDGYVILRPKSSLHIPVYRIDTQDPSNSQFKMELQKGVVRSISGHAVPAARQNFRFNTPIAAIGVLGTDFTVFTDQDTTRVAVAQGGVVVSGWGDGCQADGIGPCNTAQGRQLLANQVGQILQVQRGADIPQILGDAALAPDLLAPAKTDEPGRKVPAEQVLDGSSDTLQALKASLLEQGKLLRPAPVETVTSPSNIQWGRWNELAQADGSFSLVEAKVRSELVGLNSYFAVLRAKDASWITPQQSSVSFRLQDAKALVVSNHGIEPARLENASLRVDFGASTFSTGFDLVTAGGENFARHAKGVISRDGKFDNSVIMGGNNMVLQGAVAQQPSSNALEAGYVFQSRIDEHRLSTGATYWKAMP